MALQRYDTHLGTWEQVRHIKVGTSAVVNLQPMERVLFRGSAFEGYRWSRVEFCHVEDGVYVIENLRSR